MADPAALPTLEALEPVTLWGVDGRVKDWLERHGGRCRIFDEAGSGPGSGREVILVGDLASAGQAATKDDWQALARRVAQGSVAVLLAPAALRRYDDPVGWLPLTQKGRGYEFNDWLYHKKRAALPHPVFAGLAGHGIMDWDFYGPVISRFFIFDGQSTPSEVMAAAFALGDPCPGGYASGMMLGAYRFGAGQLIANSFKILDNVDAILAADRLLLNLIHYAAGCTGAAPAALPADFADVLQAIGYA